MVIARIVRSAAETASLFLWLVGTATQAASWLASCVMGAWACEGIISFLALAQTAAPFALPAAAAIAPPLVVHPWTAKMIGLALAAVASVLSCCKTGTSVT